MAEKEAQKSGRHYGWTHTTGRCPGCRIDELEALARRLLGVIQANCHVETAKAAEEDACKAGV